MCGSKKDVQFHWSVLKYENVLATFINSPNVNDQIIATNKKKKVKLMGFDDIFPFAATFPLSTQVFSKVLKV